MVLSLASCSLSITPVSGLDRFEWQAVNEILQMRENQIDREAGYNTFEEYCQAELSAWGGYQRINQLLGAKKVIDAVGF